MSWNFDRETVKNNAKMVLEVSFFMLETVLGSRWFVRVILGSRKYSRTSHIFDIFRHRFQSEFLMLSETALNEQSDDF